MIHPARVLRLNIPLWQGGDNPGYRTGGQVLAAIAPKPLGPVETIEIPEVTSCERPTSKGIKSRDALLSVLKQTKDVIAKHDPQAIVTLGGDCLVNLAPVSYLNQAYEDDLAIIWIDAHPDIMTPKEFSNAHAHILAILMGQGDPDFVATVPVQVKPENVLYVGLTEPTDYENKFIDQNRIRRLSPEKLKEGSAPVVDWLRDRKLRHVAIHFDLDVLDPALYDFLLFRNPSVPPHAFDNVAKGRMTMEQILTILADVSSVSSVVGLAITEYLPWGVIEFARQLERLPLLGTVALPEA